VIVTVMAAAATAEAGHKGPKRLHDD